MTGEQKLALRAELARHAAFAWDEVHRKPRCLCGEHLREPRDLSRQETVLTVHLVDVIERFLEKWKAKSDK